MRAEVGELLGKRRSDTAYALTTLDDITALEIRGLEEIEHKPVGYWPNGLHERTDFSVNDDTFWGLRAIFRSHVINFRDYNY